MSINNRVQFNGCRNLQTLRRKAESFTTVHYTTLHERTTSPSYALNETTCKTKKHFAGFRYNNESKNGCCLWFKSDLCQKSLFRLPAFSSKWNQCRISSLWYQFRRFDKSTFSWVSTFPFLFLLQNLLINFRFCNVVICVQRLNLNQLTEAR